MRLSNKYIGLAALLVAVTVQAQTPPPKPVAPDEMRTRTELIKKDIAEDNRHVLHLQALARKEKDVIKLTCVNDKLVELKAQSNIFDESARELRATLGGSVGDHTASFGSVSEAAQAVHKLRGDADSCVGEPELVGESANDVTHPPFPDNPTIGDPFGNGVEPPGYASPFN
jgi:hypothetical protein